MSQSRADELISALALRAHPEGGRYAESYRAEMTIETPTGERSASTAIYFLLERGSFSALHRVRSDEVWHHYEGAAVELILLTPDGRVQHQRLGRFGADRAPQFTVPAGVWQAARLLDESETYALCGCTVAPGFDFDDFELADRDSLSRAYPEHARMIAGLTR